MKRYRILLADDHALFREGLAGLINAEPDLQVIGEAQDGLEAFVKAKELQPDLVLMDISMPGCDGLEGTRLIRRELPDMPIVILTVRDDEEQLFEAIRSGCQGYMLKNMHADVVISMLRGALRGEAAITPALAGRILEEFRRISRAAPASAKQSSQLTRREHEVLNLVATGATDKEIAESLTLSLYTVKSHMRNILAKLQVDSRTEAARIARAKGLDG